MSTGQCKTDPVSGIAGDIFTAWAGTFATPNADAGLSVQVVAPNPGPTYPNGIRNLVAAQIEAIAASITASTGGGVAPALTPTAKSSGFTAAAGNHYRCNATGGAFSATLPAGASNAGKLLSIKKIDSSGNAVTLVRSGGDTIDGATSLALSVQGEAALLVGHSSGWDLI